MANDLSAAIDTLADAVPSGHLLAATGGAGLLRAAANRINTMKDEIAQLVEEKESLRYTVKQLLLANKQMAQEVERLRAEEKNGNS